MRFTEIISESSGTRLKDIAKIATNMPDADFWLVRKGSDKTVGKPVKEFDPSRIGVKVVKTDVLDPNYLYYAMMNLHNQGHFARIANGTTNLVNITVNDIANIPLDQQGMTEEEVIPMQPRNPLNKNLIIQLKALSETALEIFWEGSYMPTAAQGQMAQLSQQEQTKIFNQNVAQFKALGYETAIFEDDMDILFLHSIAREAWYDSKKPMSKYRGLPDLEYNSDTNSLKIIDLIGDDDKGIVYDKNVYEQDVAEGAEQQLVTIYTNPAYKGATVDDRIKKSLPVTETPFNKLQMWENGKSMKDPKVAQWVNNNLLPQLKQNGKLGPLVVWNNKGKLFVIDGNHRFIAYQAAGYNGNVPVQIVPDKMINIVDTVPGQQGVAEGENWSKHNNKRVGGMSKKSVKSYRRSHPGSKIQTAVTTKPSKLKKGSKAAKRRKSFCARMKGMKKSRTSAKTARDPNSNINKSLRRWNCESIEQMEELLMLAEQMVAKARKEIL